MNDDWQDALPPHARDVIASADLDDCDEAAFERMQNKVRAAVLIAGVSAGAAGASAAAAEGSAASAAGAVALKGAISLKLLGTFVLGAALVGGVTWTASQNGAETGRGESAETAEAAPESSGEAESREAESREAESMAVQEAESMAAQEAERTTPQSETGPEPAEPSRVGARLEPEAGPALRPAARARERRPREPGAEARSPSGGAEPNRTEEAAPPGTFVDELRLLRELRQAAQNTPTRALALAREHRARFAGSGLAPERDVYRIQALVRLNRREDAGAAAAAFHRRFPGSAYAARVDALLQD